MTGGQLQMERWRPRRKHLNVIGHCGLGLMVAGGQPDPLGEEGIFGLYVARAGRSGFSGSRGSRHHGPDHRATQRFCDEDRTGTEAPMMTTEAPSLTEF